MSKTVSLAVMLVTFSAVLGARAGAPGEPSTFVAETDGSAAMAIVPPVPPNQPEAPPCVTSSAIAEVGFVDPIRHTIQFGKSGTSFDYVEDGGQDVLFPTLRLSVEAKLRGAHTFVFLYQPIDLLTTETLREDLTVDDVVFPAGTPVDFRYGFDFYRASYLYDFWSHDPAEELSLGGGLQLRNAVIDFTSADGTLRRTNRDVGPVPLIKARIQQTLVDRWWWGAEADGMYAPVKYINGGRSDVEGAILDASLRVGYLVARPLDLFFNVRYLGGGAKGTSKADSERGPGDGYTSNWLHFWSSTLGARVHLEPLLQ